MKKCFIIGKILVTVLIMLGTRFSEAGFNPSNCPGDMFSYWTFDDQTNPGKDDYNGHDGQVEGASWTDNGQVGGDLYFDFVNNDGVYIGDIRPISSSSTGAVTYTFWGKPDVVAGEYTQVQMWKSYPYDDKEGDLLCRLDYNNGQLSIRAMIYAGGWNPSYIWATPVSGDASVYHHVACVYDSDRLYKYFDGQLVNSADVPDGISDASNNNPLVIGRQGPLSNPYDACMGYMDEVAVFSRALTADEIQKLYEKGQTGKGYCAPSYTFDGFYAPVDNPPVMNLAKAGQTIPLKWRVTDDNGDPVTDLTSVEVKATTLPCDEGTTLDQIDEYTAGNSGLQNLGDGYYQFNWKTPKSYANSCKTLKLNLGDDVIHEALFRFNK